MNSHYVVLVVLSLLLIRPASTEAQRILDPHFSIIGAVGAGWDGGRKWTFESYDYAPITPGMSFSVGLEYGPLVRLAGALVAPSVELSFGEERASQSFPAGLVTGGIQRMPIMLWVRVMSETELSPFLRIGAGVAKTDFREDASSRRGATIRFHEWHFSWGFGGGLNYQIADRISTELFIDVWESEADILGPNSRGRQDGIFDRYGLQAFGLRGLFSL